MSTLHVRDVPEELYAQLVARARRARRSISAETIELLSQALVDRPEQQAALLESIRRRRARRAGPTVPDSGTLLREDR